jgi:hypothetical protein
MADLEDLGRQSITEMTTDESLELLRQLRLKRRTPAPRTTPTTRVSPKQQQVKISAAINPDQAAELLKLLKGR